MARQAAELHQERGGGVEAMEEVHKIMEAGGICEELARADTETVEGAAWRRKVEAEGRQERTRGVLSDERLEAGRAKFRARQGVGADGHSGYHLRLAGERTWAAYKEAMRGAAADLEQASMRLREARKKPAQRAAREAVRAAVPEAWTRWLVILLPKPGKKADRMSNMRDIYLQPHGLKLFMNGLKPMYDLCAEGVLPRAQAGLLQKNVTRHPWII